MGKKISKLRKLLPDQVDPPSHAVILGAETSELPQPLQAAVERSGRWKVPRTLRKELALWILAGPPKDQELEVLLEESRDVLKGRRDPESLNRHLKPAAPPPSLSPEEWQDRAHARANEVTAEAQNHRFLGLWLRNQPTAWQGLQNSLREAIEAFTGHRGDSRRGDFKPQPGGCDWRWLFPPQPEKKDLNGRPAFADPMHLALWSWIRHGEVSLTVRSEDPNKRQIGKRVTALRDTILGDCSGGTLRIRHRGLLQVLAESFEPGSSPRMELVVAHSRERPDGTRISSKGLPMNAIEPLLAGKKEEKLDPIGDAIQRCRIRRKLGLTHG